MKKYIIAGIIILLLISGGVIYYVTGQKQNVTPDIHVDSTLEENQKKIKKKYKLSTGEEVEIEMPEEMVPPSSSAIEELINIQQNQ